MASNEQENELWQRFESGTNEQLATFLASAVPGRPVRVILGPEWNGCEPPPFDQLRSEIDFRFLSVRGNTFGDRGIAAACSTPHLRFTLGVSFDHCGISDAGVAEFLAARCAREIHALSLVNGVGVRVGLRNQISDASTCAIARSRWLENLARIDLRGTDVTTAGIAKLLQSPGLPCLQSIHCQAVPLSKESFYELEVQSAERKRRMPDSPQVALFTDQNRASFSEW